ncbi:MAG: DUF4166 domain-containing protein [Pseudomonadota bacterium]
MSSLEPVTPTPTDAPERQRETAAAPLRDLRFRALVGERAWSGLPAAVRARFSKRLAPGEIALYKGAVVATELSRIGRVLAFLARVIGAPLPLTDGATGPAVVAVTEEPSLGGQIWSRSYARAGRFPQVVHSAKRFRGPTGLEEHVGGGIAMMLVVSVEASALVFRSAGYVLELGRLRIRLPRLLEPGVMTITHRDLGSGRFAFELALDHPRIGRLLHQLAIFSDL